MNECDDMPVGGLEFFRLNENAEERMVRKKDRERGREMERNDKEKREREMEKAERVEERRRDELRERQTDR